MPLAAVLLVVLVLLAPRAAAAASWAWPLAEPHPVTRGFAPGPQPWAPGHRGVDLVAPAGSPVLAAGDGRVTFAAVLAGRGVVVVTHGALRTTYEPVTADVRVGEGVLAGGRLGALAPGHPGCPAAACLHWGLLRGETYLDPLRLVRQGPVRLLPREPGLPAGAPRGPAAAARADQATRVPPDPSGTEGPGPPAAAVALASGTAALGVAAVRRRSRRAGF